jgi:hypothetical protein
VHKYEIVWPPLFLWLMLSKIINVTAKKKKQEDELETIVAE